MSKQTNSFLDNYFKKINKNKSLSRLKKERLFLFLLAILLNTYFIFFLSDPEITKISIITSIVCIIVSSLQIKYKSREDNEQILAGDSTSTEKKNDIYGNIIFALFLIFAVPPAVTILMTPNLEQTVKRAWCQLIGGNPVDCLFKR